MALSCRWRSRPQHQERTHAPQQMPSLFDHFVGELLKLQRHIEAERFGRLEIYYQLEFRRLPDRQIGGAAPPHAFFLLTHRPPGEIAPNPAPAPPQTPLRPMTLPLPIPPTHP